MSRAAAAREPRGAGDAVLLVTARKLRAARGVTVATDVALSAAPGDVIAVEGPNGSGKTTLLAAAAGLLPDGRNTIRPASIGYAPERASLLPRIAVYRWLASLGRTAGLSRQDSAGRAGDLLRRLGLDPYASRPVHTLSRGNCQRALVAQALIADPSLVILDEPSGGLDEDGVSRVAKEITRAAAREAVVLVATHPTAPVPLPPGVTWRFADGTIRTSPRPGAAALALPPGTGDATFEVETGDGAIRRAGEDALPGLLRAALDAGLPVRRVQQVTAPTPAGLTAGPAAGLTAGPAAGLTRGHAARNGLPSRLLHGAAHRAWLLGVSQWFFAPLLVFLAVLATIYATDAGPPLQPAAITAITLIPVLTWLTVLAHRVDGRELGRAFAAHIGGRGRAHLAADLGVVPFAAGLSAAAVLWPLASQGSHPHPAILLLRIAAVQLAASVLGIGLGSALALIDRIGWRLVVAVAAFLCLVLIRHTPLTPLMRLGSAAVTATTPVGTESGWLLLSGCALAAAAGYLATRIS